MVTAAGGLAAGTTAGCSRKSPGGKADYTLRISHSDVEVAPGKLVPTTTYNGQFPGPLLRFTEGKQTTVDVYNDTNTPEQLHWHGQQIPVDVDGSSEEGTPFIPAHGMRRISFVPGPSGFRFYHTHLNPGADLTGGQYGGLVGPVYIEPKNEPGAYDREVFLTLKEFEPTLSQGGDMPGGFLAGDPIADLRDKGERAMAASLAAGMARGYEVGYGTFTVNGRTLGHGDPIRVKTGDRILLHVLNGSATENRSLALAGHNFTVVALDGNPVPKAVAVPVLWLGAAERISAIVEMSNPGIWILGDLSDDDRQAGMGIVVEYAGRTGDPQWAPPPPFQWDYRVSPTPATTLRRSITSSTCSSRSATPPATGSTSGPSMAPRSRWAPTNRSSTSCMASATGCGSAMPAMTSTRCICTGTPSKSLTLLAARPPVSARMSPCSAATRPWTSIFWPTNPDCRCCTATSKYTWTSDSWRCCVAREPHI